MIWNISCGNKSKNPVHNRLDFLIWSNCFTSPSKRPLHTISFQKNRLKGGTECQLNWNHNDLTHWICQTMLLFSVWNYICWHRTTLVLTVSTTTYYDYSNSRSEDTFKKALVFLTIGDLWLPCLPMARVMSNLSESHVSNNLCSKQHTIGFKAEHRVVPRGIYHVYEYKFRPAWNVPTK